MRPLTPNFHADSLLNVQEVADLLRIHPTTVRKLIAKGELPAVRSGREWRIRYRDIWRVGT